MAGLTCLLIGVYSLALGLVVAGVLLLAGVIGPGLSGL